MTKIKRLRVRDLAFLDPKPAKISDVTVCIHGRPNDPSHVIWDFLDANFVCNKSWFTDPSRLEDDDERCIVDYLVFSKHAALYTELPELWSYIVGWYMDSLGLTFNRFRNILNFSLKKDEWFIIGMRRDRASGSVQRRAYILRVPDQEQQRKLNRQLHVELVSVPTGRFGRLLPEGGVEYQRQLAQLAELASLN